MRSCGKRPAQCGVTERLNPQAAHHRPRLRQHIGFSIALLVGFFIAALVFLILAIGECLPRDDSAQMQACEAIKRRDVWLYPVLFMASAGGSIVMHLRSASLALLFAVTSGLIAAAALMVVNAYFA